MLKSLKTTLFLTLPIVTGLALLAGLGGAFAPLFIAFGMAYFLMPAILWCEKRGVSRGIAAGTLFFLVFLVLIAVVSVILPKLYRDLIAFGQELPAIIGYLSQKIELIAAKAGLTVSLDRESLIAVLKETQSNLSVDLVGSASEILTTRLSGVMSSIVTLMNFLLIPIFFYYLILDYEGILDRIWDWLPDRYRPAMEDFFSHTDTILSGYIRGQLLVALILAALYSIGLTLTGLRFGFLIGLGTGLLSIIPYAGFGLGSITALAVAIVQNAGWGLFVSVAAVFAVIQLVESFVITPKIVGDKVGLNALVTMLALIVGGNVGGLAGMLVAVPAAAILKYLITQYKQQYTQLPFYTALPASASEPADGESAE